MAPLGDGGKIILKSSCKSIFPHVIVCVCVCVCIFGQLYFTDEKCVPLVQPIVTFLFC